jgi:hypothetical protein
VDPAGRVWIAWEDQGSGERDIRLVHSDDSGRTWSAERRVDADPPGAASSFHPTIVPDGGGVVVSWWDLRDGLADVYVRRMGSEDGASGPETRVDPGPPGSTSSHEASLMRTASGTLRIRWREGFGQAPFVARESSDGGKSWGATAPSPPPPDFSGPAGIRHQVRVLPAAPGRLEYLRNPDRS